MVGYRWRKSIPFLSEFVNFRLLPIQDFKKMHPLLLRNTFQLPIENLKPLP